jgi:hypothetical protein
MTALVSDPKFGGRGYSCHRRIYWPDQRPIGAAKLVADLERGGSVQHRLVVTAHDQIDTAGAVFVDVSEKIRVASRSPCGFKYHANHWLLYCASLLHVGLGVMS